MTLHLIRPANDADVDRVAALWTEASRNLADRGYDQWQYPVRTANIQKSVDMATCWIIDDDDGSLAATITLDTDAAPNLWHPGDQPTTALYAHRLVVKTDRRGHDLGSAVLDWAGHRANTSGKHWLRLDAWTNNLDLHSYYLRRKFELVRLLNHPDIVSGALFQRPAMTTTGNGPLITTADRIWHPTPQA